MKPPDVTVVGGGLAGITTALACADAGLRVVLQEARPRLGGRTTSFTRALADRTDIEVDTGQHVFMRCCTAYRALVQRLGGDSLVALQPRLDVPVVHPSGTTARIRRRTAPAPLHLLPALAGYRLLPLSDRLRLGRAALALGLLDPADPATDEISFGEWLSRHGQSPRAVEALWDLITVATLNSPASRSSLALAATVFQIGLLTDTSAGDLGWARVPLGHLHGDLALNALRGAGVEVQLGVKPSLLDFRNGAWHLDGFVTDRVVLAVPPPAAERLVPFEAEWGARLSASPIVNVHLIYDRPVLTESFVATVDSPVQWVFDRTEASGLKTGGQYLAVSISSASEMIGRPARAIIDEIAPAVTALFPGGNLQHAFVTREASATFSPAPGTGKWRPGPRTHLPGLFLAGSWTATGWPDTMEGAVRSGNSAAAAVLADTPFPARTEVPV